jgi:predicted acylesterase/phospholipase RssA
MERLSTLPHSVGLCLSGGGFRAAAFHLGTLSYLHRVGLLDTVELLSTVSGGTFTGARLALAHVEGVSPEDFFRAYYGELRDIRIFECALQLLGSPRELQNASRRKDLITCAAEVYSTKLFEKRDGTPCYLEDILSGNTGRLGEISFNATDFRTGLAFRFQKTAGGLIGNFLTRIDPKEAGRLRLGDVVAASSCFPGGFEPLEFPDDLAWKDGIPDGVGATFAAARSPLMDGGVYDNQGLESLLYADERRRQGPAGAGVDLVIISDTDQSPEALYRIPGPLVDTILQSNASWAVKLLCRLDPQLKWFARAAQAMIVLCWLVVLAIAINLGVTVWSGASINHLSLTLTSIIPLLLAGGTAFLVSGLRGMLEKDLLEKIPQLQGRGWEHLREVPLSRALDMVSFRVSSLLALTSSVFMKRIRSAGLARVFDDPRYTGRIAANLIYQLIPGHRWDFEAPDGDKEMLPGLGPELLERLKAVPRPTEALRSQAEIAAGMPTTLWFNHDSELPALVAAGQFTACLTLMKFVARTRVFDPSKGTFAGEVGPLWEKMLADWVKFNDSPQFLVSEVDPGNQKRTAEKTGVADAPAR